MIDFKKIGNELMLDGASCVTLNNGASTLEFRLDYVKRKNKDVSNWQIKILLHEEGGQKQLHRERFFTSIHGEKGAFNRAILYALNQVYSIYINTLFPELFDDESEGGSGIYFKR